MKKIVVGISAILCLALWLMSCGGRASGDEQGYLREEELPIDSNAIVVGLSQVGSESDWRIANTESIKRTFTEENGYFLIFDDAQQKQENQLKAMRNFILQDVEYIILDPIVETGWDAVLEEAKAAKIPVIIMDRKVQVQDESLYTCWVGSNFEEQGRKAGEWLAQYLTERGRKNNTIHMVTLQGNLGSTAQIGRTEGFTQILEQHENWNMLERRDGDFTQTKGEEVMADFLKIYSDIDVVISENDNMTFGAIEAIEEAGKTCGPEGEIVIISFDAASAALEAMKNGKINVDFECNPELGPMVSEVIQKLEQGEAVEKYQYVEETYFDPTMDLETLIPKRTY